MNKVQRFIKNTIGKDFVVGDIHGCFSKLKAELTQIGFNEETDRLFAVGDLVDRGPESEDCLKWLNKKWFYSVRGNHEQFCIDYLLGLVDKYSHIAYGGQWFYCITEHEQQCFSALFDDLPIAIEIETDNGLIGIIHAECPVNDWNNLEKELNGERADLFKDISLLDRSTIENKSFETRNDF